MEELVDYKTALLAKEMGFKYPCSRHFISYSYMEGSVEPILTHQYSLITATDEVRHLKELTNLDFKAFYDLGLSGALHIWTKAVTAPTLSSLQKWFREEKKIYIEVHTHKFKTPELKVMPRTFKFSVDGVYHFGDFKTYEETLRFALFQELDTMRKLLKKRK